MIDKAIHEKILESQKAGVSIRKTALELGIDRETVRKYRDVPLEHSTRLFSSIESLNESCKTHYAYILGLYLGDGDISKFPRTFRLRLYFNSETNSRIIARSIVSLNNIFRKNRRSKYKQRTANCTEVSIYSNVLPTLFPQHGTGKKHSRDVSLKDNQQWLFDDQYAKILLAGLHDSDGCFYSEGKYDRFMFTNTSDDIIRIYKKILDMYNIHYTESSVKREGNERNITRIFTRKQHAVRKLATLLESSYNELELLR